MSSTRYSPKFDDWSSYTDYPPDWQDRRRIVLNRDDHRCAGCGRKSIPSNELKLDIHHVTPKSEGGSHALDNLEPLCPNCHSREHPGNRELYERSDLPPFVVRLVLVPLATILQVFMVFFGSSNDIETSQIAEIEKADGRVNLEAKVVNQWEETSDKMLQAGLLSDGEDKIKFVAWNSDEVRYLEEYTEYLIKDAVRDTYDGDVRVKLDSYTEVEPVN